MDLSIVGSGESFTSSVTWASVLSLNTAEDHDWAKEKEAYKTPDKCYAPSVDVPGWVSLIVLHFHHIKPKLKIGIYKANEKLTRMDMVYLQ